jgi:hypothetical protein
MMAKMRCSGDETPEEGRNGRQRNDFLRRNPSKTRAFVTDVHVRGGGGRPEDEKDEQLAERTEDTKSDNRDKGVKFAERGWLDWDE